MDAAADALDVALGERIRLRRRQLGLSQAALGDRLDVSFQQVQKYERGANRVSFSTLVRVAQTLECRVADLIGELDDPATAPVTIASRAPQLASAEMNELLCAYGAISSKALRRNILRLAQALANPVEAEAA